ncbi:MAG: nicotinate (nicotinamide) nucleotide adenylyltransferase [Clostridia bacterium]|nr:nicotinate (nicotinamide) nucleotide adenylyltransferase [Clostridia bacterium]
MNIILFGGTFNPFHNGHYLMLKTICKMEKTDKVLVIPDHIPPHKTTDYLASDQDRINMCKAVCDEFSKAEVSDIEIIRKGKSYTVDTVNELKKTYIHDDFYFVCGADMISILDKWYNWQELIGKVTFLAFSRNDNGKFIEDVNRMKKLGAKIEIISTPIPDISSTSLRNKLDENYLPKCVYDYIKEKGLYNA